jgi:hypothetical protein
MGNWDDEMTAGSTQMHDLVTLKACNHLANHFLNQIHPEMILHACGSLSLLRAGLLAALILELGHLRSIHCMLIAISYRRVSKQGTHLRLMSLERLCDCRTRAFGRARILGNRCTLEQYSITWGRWPLWSRGRIFCFPLSHTNSPRFRHIEP